MANEIQKRQNQSTSVMLRLPDSTYSLNDLGDDLMIFSKPERQVIEARCKGISLCDQTEKQLAASMTGIIFQVSVICGCPLPTHEAHVAALENEFKLFLTDNGYGGLTPEEVLTAFRMNANFQLEEKVETYNRIFNIDFAAAVLCQYRRIRVEADAKAEKIFEGRDIREKMKQDDMRRRRKVKEQFEKFISNPDAALDLSDCFMQLRHDGAFANKKIQDEPRGMNSIGGLLNGFEKLEERFVREHEAVRYLFANMVRTGRTEIYNDELELLHPGFELPERFENKPE